MKQTKALTSAADKALAALVEAVEQPTTMTNRRAAEAIVRLRKHFRHEGRPDWAGRSPEYRDLIERLYRQAGVPSDSESSMQANLRYHIGNALREVADPEDLQALGMATEGPAGRVRAVRAARPRRPRLARPGIGDPAALASLALETVRTLRSMDPDGDVEPALRLLLDEVLDTLRQVAAADPKA